MTRIQSASELRKTNSRNIGISEKMTITVLYSGQMQAVVLI